MVWDVVQRAVAHLLIVEVLVPSSRLRAFAILWLLHREAGP
jgi:hypothetical protein